MKFKDLQINQTFDFISPNISFNSFFNRCMKKSKRKYIDDMGIPHLIGSINCEVYHVADYEENFIKDWNE